jgi:hypothetical protein
MAGRPGTARGTAIVGAEIVLLADDDRLGHREAGENERRETGRE